MSSTQVIVSQSTTNQYFVTVDSNYRDAAQYPNSTDFGVSFKTKDQNANYPLGLPVDPTQMFPRFTIDKNFNRFDFACRGGIFTSSQVDSQGNIILGGVIKHDMFAENGDNFQITYQDQVLFQIIGTIYEDAPFVAKFTSSYTPIWMITKQQTFVYSTNTQGQKTQQCYIALNSDDSVLCMFDFANAPGSVSAGGSTLVKYVYNPTTQSSTIVPFRTFRYINPYQNLNATPVSQFIITPQPALPLPSCSCVGIFAFSADGNIYEQNGNPWGYHTFYTDGTLIPQLPSTIMVSTCSTDMVIIPMH